MARKTFNEKLQFSGDLPRIVIVEDPRTIQRMGGPRMLIAAPLDYDAEMKRVPFGQVTTADAIRSCLARRSQADFTCPLTAGIFINVAAQASAERGADPTPYWRTLKTHGALNEKYPMGAEGQKLLLEQEGHTIIRKGRQYYVKDYEDKLFLPG
jgi:hypothetical protein